MLWGAWEGRQCGLGPGVPNILPDLKDGDAALRCYQWERTSGWEADAKRLDAEASWWMSTRSFLSVGLFLPCCRDHEACALGGTELQRSHLANKFHE